MENCAIVDAAAEATLHFVATSIYNASFFF